MRCPGGVVLQGWHLPVKELPGPFPGILRSGPMGGDVDALDQIPGQAQREGLEPPIGVRGPPSDGRRQRLTFRTQKSFSLPTGK
jgi:hypothetical protein